jgi:thiamine-phosphate pyrophosphorylase
LLGLDGLAAIANAVHVPVLAIGGVTIDRIPAVASAGGAGVAAIGLFMDASPVGCRATSLQAIAQAARSPFDTSGSRS